MPEHPLKIYEDLDPKLLQLVNNTKDLALADGALPRKVKLLIAMVLDAVHGASDGCAVARPRGDTGLGNPGGEIPSGFRVRGQFTNVTTTASYDGPITVCLPYDPSTPNPQNLKIFHWQGGHWVDVTTGVDTVNHRVCGQVDSLSWFFIGGEWVWIEGGRGVPVFPSLYVGIAAAFGAGVLAYFVRRRVGRHWLRFRYETVNR